MFCGKPKEILPPEGELAVAVRVHDEPHHVRDWQALRTLSLTVAAHAAEVGANFLELGCQDLRVGFGERLCHRLEVLLQLVLIRHARHGTRDGGIIDGPLQSRERESGGPLRLRCGCSASATTGAGHYLHGHQPNAGRAQLLDRWAIARGRGEVVLRLHHVHLGLDDPIDDGRQIMCAHSDEPDLALLLGRALRVEQVVGNIRRAVLAVQMPDVQMIGVEFFEAGLQLRQGACLVLGVYLARQDDVFSFGAQRGRYHALVLAALVPTRGVEEGDAHVHSLGNHSGVGCDHAAETHGRDFETRLAEDAVLNCGL